MAVLLAALEVCEYVVPSDWTRPWRTMGRDRWRCCIAIIMAPLGEEFKDEEVTEVVAVVWLRVLRAKCTAKEEAVLVVFVLLRVGVVVEVMHGERLVSFVVVDMVVRAGDVTEVAVGCCVAALALVLLRADTVR
jgi:hypothetical protein